MSQLCGAHVGRLLLQHSNASFQPGRWAGFLSSLHTACRGINALSSSNSCCCSQPFSTYITSSTSSTSSGSSASSSNSSAGSDRSMHSSPASSSESSKAREPTSSSSTQLKPDTQEAKQLDSRMQQQAWQQELQAVRAHVFEHHIGDGRRNGRKAILKPLKGRYIADWYWTLTGPHMPMMTNELEEQRQARVELARATGGGPPKKGQGKRAKK